MPFLTPYPPRPKGPLPLLRRLRIARRNFLEMWDEEAFGTAFMLGTLLRRQIAVCNSPATVRAAFVDNAAAFERKSPQMRHALKPLLGDGLFISDGPLWQRRRRMVAPVIHGARTPEFAPTMVEAAAETRDRWAALPPGTEIDALGEMARLAAEIISRTIFGRALGRAHAGEVVEAFSDYQEHIGQVDAFSFLGLPDWVPRRTSAAAARAAGRIDAVMDEVIGAVRASARAGDGAVMRGLMDAEDRQTGERLDDRALRNEATVIFMAGHETTANTLAWALFLLSQAATKEAALLAELDAVLAGRLPRLEDVPRLPYTRAVIEETLRLYPPVPLLAREAIADAWIEGRLVRRGAIVMVVPWLLHRRPRLWKHPDFFIPERFLPDAARPIDRYAYVPFSIGPRVCAGQTFGLTEAILCLATLAQGFRLRLRPGARVMPVCRLTLRPGGDGLPMTPVPRGRR